MKKSNRKVKGGFDYDSINDSFFSYAKNKKYSESKQIDNFIIDFNDDGEINAVEILNASKVLKLPKNILKHAVEMTINLNVNKDIVNIELILKFSFRNAEKQNIISIEKINSDLLNPVESCLSIA